MGLMAALSCNVRGASKVMVVDRHSDRLALAEKIGAIGIDDSRGDPVEQVLEHTGGEGADKGCECVGWRAHDADGNEHNYLSMNALVQAARATGAIGVVGVFPPTDPKGPDKLSKDGKMAFDFGTYFTKGLRSGTGQANVKAYNRQLRDLISSGRAEPSFIVSHELPLAEAPERGSHGVRRNTALLGPLCRSRL